MPALVGAVAELLRLASFAPPLFVSVAVAIMILYGTSVPIPKFARARGWDRERTSES